MVRKLYHGSCSIIEKPVFGQGKRYNDYGLGFYCTDSLEMAKEWGVSHDKNGYANCYELDCVGLRILDLNDPQYCLKTGSLMCPPRLLWKQNNIS